MTSPPQRKTETTFTYRKNRVASAIVAETAWPADSGEYPNSATDIDYALEAYAYNVFGERVGIQHCAMNDDNSLGPGAYGTEYPDAAATCRSRAMLRAFASCQINPLQVHRAARSRLLTSTSLALNQGKIPRSL